MTDPYTPTLRQLRSDRTKTSNSVRRLIAYLLTQPVTPPAQIMPNGLPSWWPFWSDALKSNVRTCVRAARALDLAEARAHGYDPQLTP